MKKQLLLTAFIGSFAIASCGGDQENPSTGSGTEKTDFCECTKPGEVPEGCDYVQKMDSKEYFEKVKECDHYKESKN